MNSYIRRVASSIKITVLSNTIHQSIVLVFAPLLQVVSYQYYIILHISHTIVKQFYLFPCYCV